MVNLFDYQNGNQILRLPFRPLGNLSSFVVEQMPVLLDQIRQGTATVSELSQQVEQLVATFHIDLADQLKGNHRIIDIALLDLKMLECAIVHSSGKPPDSLIAMVDSFASNTGQISGITYEDVILINPPADRRTFTTGLIGKSEADFYETHRLIELHMDVVIDLLWESVGILTAQGPEGITDAIMRIQEASVELKLILPYMERVGTAMDMSHFELFTRYLGSHPYRQLNGIQMRGASGAFSATIPVADLLVAGENLKSDHLVFLQANMPYYPRAGREHMARAYTIVQQRKTLFSFYKTFGKPKVLLDELKIFAKFLRQFRGSHFAGVKNKNPRALTGEIVGTGGELKAEEFLKNRIHTDYFE